MITSPTHSYYKATSNPYCLLTLCFRGTLSRNLLGNMARTYSDFYRGSYYITVDQVALKVKSKSECQDQLPPDQL